MNASTNNLPLTLRTTNSGFTLIELMVTIAVLAIIVGIAAPSISNQLANQRVKSTASMLENALKESRNESIIRRQEVTLSYKNNGNNMGDITITDNNSNVISTYKYDVKSKIKPNNNQVQFKPNKTVDSGRWIYTICDDNAAANSKQVSITKLGIVSSKLGGSC